jgi:hypothetical protein
MSIKIKYDTLFNYDVPIGNQVTAAISPRTHFVVTILKLTH